MSNKVVIVEALSTGFNYVHDCLERGLEPIILEVNFPDSKTLLNFEAEREKKYRKLNTEIQIFKEKASYDETLELVRELDPLLVIPGAEYGVILATKLANDLRLPGNPYSMIDRMTNKYFMHKTLEASGIRHIRGKICKTVDEAVEYYDQLGVDSVVVKPPHGAGSMGVRFCDSMEELTHLFNEQLNQVGRFGDVSTELLVQERIIGTEYIVNTITFEGEHRITSIWKYEKRKLQNGSNVYLGSEAVDEVNFESYMLSEYAFKVLDAIGIKQGPVHGEYIIDNHGPVLVEINCRCMGGSYPIEYGDAIFGHHETDIALDSYINPDAVRSKLSRRYGINMYAIGKDLVSPDNMRIVNSPIIGILPYLKSYHSSSISTSASKDNIDKTVDLDTEAGVVYMLNNDYSELRKDYELLCNLEKNYFGLLYQESYDKSLGALPVIVADEGTLDNFTIKQPGLLNYPIEDVYQYLKDVIKVVKPGGTITIPKQVYDDFPYGLSGMITILKIFNLEILMPIPNSVDLLAIKPKLFDKM